MLTRPPDTRSSRSGFPWLEYSATRCSELEPSAVSWATHTVPSAMGQMELTHSPLLPALSALSALSPPQQLKSRERATLGEVLVSWVYRGAPMNLRMRRIIVIMIMIMMIIITMIIIIMI